MNGGYYLVVKGETKEGRYIYDLHEGSEFEESEPVPPPRARKLAGDGFTFGKWYDIRKKEEVRGFLKEGGEPEEEPRNFREIHEPEVNHSEEDRKSESIKQKIISSKESSKTPSKKEIEDLREKTKKEFGTEKLKARLSKIEEEEEENDK